MEISHFFGYEIENKTQILGEILILIVFCTIRKYFSVCSNNKSCVWWKMRDNISRGRAKLMVKVEKIFLSWFSPKG